jgi:hypothetical protein
VLSVEASNSMTLVSRPNSLQLTQPVLGRRRQYLRSLSELEDTKESESLLIMYMAFGGHVGINYLG